MEEMPKIVASLVEEVKELRESVERLTSADTSLRSVSSAKKKIMRTPDVCFLLGKTPVSIYRMVKRGELVAYKNGKELFFFEDEVLAMLEDGKMTVNCACRNA